MKARIELTRIDNRLVHGQVGLTWGSTLNIDTIVVVDNLTAASSFAQKLMQSVASAASRQIRFYTVHDFIRAYNDNTSHQKLFVVVQSPHEARLLVEAGIELSVSMSAICIMKRGESHLTERYILHSWILRT